MIFHDKFQKIRHSWGDETDWYYNTWRIISFASLVWGQTARSWIFLNVFLPARYEHGDIFPNVSNDSVHTLVCLSSKPFGIIVRWNVFNYLCVTSELTFLINVCQILRNILLITITIVTVNIQSCMAKKLRCFKLFEQVYVIKDGLIQAIRLIQLFRQLFVQFLCVDDILNKLQKIVNSFDCFFVLNWITSWNFITIQHHFLNFHSVCFFKSS